LRHFAGVTHARQHDHFIRGPSFTDALQSFQPISSGHHHVKQYEVGSFPLHLLDGFQTIGSGGDAIRVQLQNGLEVPQHTRFIVHHENVAGAH
jgi:hypothetical protein